MGKIKQWIVLHKLWSIIIASALVVAITLSVVLPITLSHKISYEVTAEQLAYALEFKDADGNDYTNWQAEEVNMSNETIRKVKLTEDGYYWYRKGMDPVERYGVNVEDGAVNYQKANADADWTTSTSSTAYSFSTLSYAAVNALSISDLRELTFEYNSEDKMYHATQDITSSATFKISVEYTLKFEDGKLVSIISKGLKETLVDGVATGEPVVTSTATMTISYGNATVELPDLNYVDATQWSKALSFDVDNFTSTMKNYTLEGGVSRSRTTYITPSSAYQRDIRAGSTTENYYDLTNKKVYGRSKSTDKYTINDASYLTSFDIMLNQASANMASHYASIKDSYAKFTYRADEKVFYAENVTLEGTNYQSAKLTFNNGKLVKTELTTETGTTIWTYTYGDAVVTLPSESECIVPIAYNSASENFTLSNVTLKANETRIFVIEISQELFNSNLDDETMKCTIDGAFTPTLSAALSTTFDTIVIKNASGTGFANASVDNGGFNFETSDAGKYYIEIKANADCTGAWDISFVV